MESRTIHDEIVDEVNIVDLTLKKEIVQGENESSNFSDDDSPRSKKVKTSNVNC